MIPDCEDGRGCELSTFDEDAYRYESLHRLLTSSVVRRCNLGDSVLRSFGIEPGSGDEAKAISAITLIDETILEHLKFLEENKNNGDRT